MKLRLEQDEASQSKRTVILMIVGFALLGAVLLAFGAHSLLLDRQNDGWVKIIAGVGWLLCGVKIMLDFRKVESAQLNV